MPKSSTIDLYLGYYEAVSCHWSSAGRKRLKILLAKEGGEMHFKRTHLVLCCGQYLQAPQEGHLHIQILTSDSQHLCYSHTHTYILVKGCLQNQQIAPLTPQGKLIFLSLSVIFSFFSPREVLGRFLT